MSVPNAVPPSPGFFHRLWAWIVSKWQSLGIGIAVIVGTIFALEKLKPSPRQKPVASNLPPDAGVKKMSDDIKAADVIVEKNEEKLQTISDEGKKKQASAAIPSTDVDDAVANWNKGK